MSSPGSCLYSLMVRSAERGSAVPSLGEGGPATAAGFSLRCNGLTCRSLGPASHCSSPASLVTLCDSHLCAGSTSSPSMIWMWRSISRICFCCSRTSACCSFSRVRFLRASSRSCWFAAESSCARSSRSMTPRPSSRLEAWCFTCSSRMANSNSASCFTRAGNSTCSAQAIFSVSSSMFCRNSSARHFFLMSVPCSCRLTSETFFSRCPAAKVSAFKRRYSSSSRIWGPATMTAPQPRPARCMC
mmetsp:Transcript_29609/g.78404  ORF Transcript_29609/g.78404 Transcript_29609/m.78404 type:complete len:244 (-) Transcript_29609:2-733(-)